MYKRTKIWSLGDGSGGKVLAVKVWRPEFDSQQSHKKTRYGETRVIPALEDGLASQPSLISDLQDK